MREKQTSIAGVIGSIALLLLVSTTVVAQSQPDVRPLSEGETVERQPKGGEIHYYTVELKQGQVLRIDVQEKGIDVGVGLMRISDRQVVAKANFGFGYDRERLTTAIEDAGNYAVIVVARQSSLSGRYQLRATIKETATASDSEEIKAEQLLAEGLAIRNKGTAEGLQATVAKWEEALPLWKKLGEMYWEAYTSTFLGIVYSDIGKKQKALEFLNHALSLFGAVGDRYGEAWTLNNIGQVHSDLGEKQKALDFYNQTLPLLRLVGNRSGEAYTLNNIGSVYTSLGEPQKALEYLNHALPLLRLVGDRSGEAAALNNIGQIHSDLGEKQKALEFLDQALTLIRVVGDKRGEATALNNIGKLYDDLGEKRKALDFYNQVLLLFRLDGDKGGEANTLNNLGSIYSDLGEKQKALEFNNQALPLFRLVGDKRGEANTLTNLGSVHSELGEKQRALEFYNQALTLTRVVGDRRGEATVLNNLGSIYSDLGEKQKALDFYDQALLLKRLVGDKGGEGVTLGNLMWTWNALGKPRLATFYGKQSINAFQQIRANIQSLDKGIQKSFLASNEFTYRVLSELLILQNRLQEAAQILDLLKLQEFSDFINRSGSPDHPTADADFSPSEDEKRRQYDQLSNRLFTLNAEYDDLSKKKARTPVEEQRLKSLEKEINQAKQQFQQSIAQLPNYFSQPLPAHEANLEINGIKPIVRDLGPGTAALYTLLAGDRYFVILFTPQLDQARHFTIKRTELEKKVKQFKEVLQSPKLDPRPAAQELYQILLGPIAAELQQAKAETLMWSLDGVLRYLPMSALYDGQQYLVEKYQNVVIDPTSQSRLREQPAFINWRGVGMGTSKALGGLKPLNNVPEELDEIIREEGGKDNHGVIPGEVLLNDDFTEVRMYEALKRNYKVVHIASHFVLSAKDARDSYLLLGDGNRLKLSQISDGAKIFDQVDLVALSACDTGSGGADTDGREVDAFGIITQQKGAKAVLASLWPVEDRSTRDVMVDFYQRLRGRRQVNKAEALRQAQLRLLRGDVQSAKTTDQVPRRGDEAKKAVNVKELQWEEEASQWPEYKTDPEARYSHPYYWAPFVLIGNWR